MHNKICKNCESEAKGNFCPSCGQTTHSGRIDLHHLLHEFTHGVLHVDSGIFFTAKGLFVRPGQMIRDYFDGKRVKHFKPFAYLFLLATIYGFMAILFKQEVSFTIDQTNQALGTDIFENINQWVYKHYALATILLLPITSFTSFLFFRKSKFNYGENLILNAYVGGQQMLISLITLFIFVLFHIDNNISFSIQFLLSVIVMLYIYCSVFNMYSKIKAIILSICAYVTTFVITSILITIIMLVLYFVF